MEELLKERRKTQVDECRDTVVAEGGVIQKAAAGSRSSEAEGDLFVTEVGVCQKKNGGGSGILWPSQAAAAERKSSSA